MAYSELVKGISRIRDYMREFFVYGFKSREEIGSKSARSYDNERRRMILPLRPQLCGQHLKDCCLISLLSAFCLNRYAYMICGFMRKASMVTCIITVTKAVLKLTQSFSLATGAGVLLK